MPFTTRDLLDIVPQQGTVTWIGLRPARKAPIDVVDRVEAIVGRGLAGDRATLGRKVRPGKRQVTLFQVEHLAVLESILGRPVPPELLRRNVHVQGINLHSLKKRHFRVGSALLEATGLADPCHRMEDALGPGGFNAMRMHCGITAKVIEGGHFGIGDAVSLVV